MIEESSSTTNQWLTPRAAAEHMRCSSSYLAKLRVNGEGPVFCRIGRAIRYRRADLDAWLESTARRSTSDTGEAR